jgi:hypothetical protein
VLEIKTLRKGQVRRFVDGPIGALIVLQYLSAKMDQFKHWVMEMKDELSAPMEQH